MRVPPRFYPRAQKKRASNEPITFWLDIAVRGKATARSHSSEAPRASEVIKPGEEAQLPLLRLSLASICRGYANRGERPLRKISEHRAKPLKVKKLT